METIRMCRTEQDAVIASIRLSGLTLHEIGKRVGVSKQAVSKWQKHGLPWKKTRPFCNATGTNLVSQYRDFERAMREAAGRSSERDRMTAIVAPTQRLWSAAA
jgi:phage terminase Nu1 subunit (DNA packaging protein)